MPDISADSMDRLLAGELSRDEERRLAQAALADPELFDALTAAAVTKAALSSPSAGSELAGAVAAAPVGATTRLPPWKPAALVGGLAAAAALVLAVLFGGQVNQPALPTPATSSAAVPAPVTTSPVLLSARVDVAATPAFRAGEAPASRAPRPMGTIVRSADGTAEIDIGSLDGLTEGMTLPIIRGSQPVGRITLTSVFRERARGRIESAVTGQAGTRADVAIDRATHLRALLEQVTARKAAGDLVAARQLATIAVAASEHAVPANLRRQSLAELGTIEHQRGNRDDALRLLQEAVGTFDAAPVATPSERVQILNELGVIQIEKRDFAAAERTLQLAQPMASGPAGVHVANNLGALAALRGDRAAAERLYRAAATIAAGAAALESDRQAVAKNLASVRPSP